MDESQIRIQLNRNASENCPYWDILKQMFDLHFLVWDKLYRSRVREGRSHVTVPLWSNRGRGLVSKKKQTNPES